MKFLLFVFFFLNTAVFANTSAYHSISFRSSTLGVEDDYELKLGFSNVSSEQVVDGIKFTPMELKIEKNN